MPACATYNKSAWDQMACDCNRSLRASLPRVAEVNPLAPRLHGGPSAQGGRPHPQYPDCFPVMLSMSTLKIATLLMASWGYS